MTIRALKNSESDFLSEMLYEAIFVPEGAVPFPRNIIREPSLSIYFTNWGKDHFDVALVAVEKEQRLGAIWGRLFSEKQPGYGFIDATTPELSMAVQPAFRNQGVGTGLLKAIFQKYQQLKVDQLSLSVVRANPACRLYQRLGFEVVTSTAKSWTMVKRLKQ
ncbi:MAG: GNAT family N-acetyltransferase [Salibacteraceae bacterium]